MICAPGALDQSYRHLLYRFYEGGYSPGFFKSNEAKLWIDYANKAWGEEFEKEVEAVFAEHGHRTFHGLQMTRVGATKADQLGEIDVLAFDLTTKTCWIIECKNLREARTVKEVSEQLNRFQGRGRDHLHQHLRRMEWINGNRKSLTQFGLADDWTIQGRMVTNTLVPMSFKKERPLPLEHWLTLSKLPFDIGSSQTSPH